MSGVQWLTWATVMTGAMMGAPTLERGAVYALIIAGIAVSWEFEP